MLSRRHRAVSCINLLELIKDQISDHDYQHLKGLVKNIFLENRSKQILPNQYGYIHAGRHKTELYLNYDPFSEEGVLEPREYIGIDPNVSSDLDAPSIVTALTPPMYQQPIHNHEHNWEITYYHGPAIAKYFDCGKEYEIEVKGGGICFIAS